jgi:glutamyl-tRNA reductase
MKNFETISPSEKEMLLKFPAYISLLAVNLNGKLNEAEKESAIHFTHIKTFSCDPMLASFYEEADQVFAGYLEKLDRELPKEKEARGEAIENELAKLEHILSKLGKAYAEAMHRSMKSFKEHVSKANHSVLESFIFPIPIKGITE